MTILVTCPVCRGSGRAQVLKHITSTTADSPYETTMCYRCGGSGFTVETGENTVDEQWRTVPILDYIKQQTELAALRSQVATLTSALEAACVLEDGRAWFRTNNGVLMAIPTARERIIRKALEAVRKGGKATNRTLVY